jgi:oligopeptide/dipeptide ABC transporter ATP-binding protein
MGLLLDIHNLTVIFNIEDQRLRIVHGVDFSVHDQEIVGLVGESGSGKTVTCLSVVGLLHRKLTAEGSICYRGREVLDMSEEERADIRGREIAMIFQDPMSALNPVRTVGYQIIEVLKINKEQSADRAVLQERALKLLQQVGLPDPGVRLKSYPHELSGGLNQRAMIAMMLANNPRLLIADEPTTALDVTVQAQILKLLVDLRQQRGMSVVIITHDLGVVAETCDRVFVMYCGRIVESGPVREVFLYPYHPYTYGLLGARPRIDRTLEELVPIQGHVPKPNALPPGCAFAPRCSRVTEACSQSVPSLSGDHRQVACINPINVERNNGKS